LTYYWRARADFQAYAQERLHLLEQISAELNGAQLEIVVDLLLAPPRQKFQEVKLFFQEIFGGSVSRETT
jgi:hypothetical protein